jgi:hypothetical protein
MIEDLTLIGVVVDRSGSMSNCRNDMQGGLNTFLQEQAALPGQLDISLAQFDTEYELLYKPTRVVNGSVDPYTLIPRGGTALYDAIGLFITQTGEYLAKLPESKRPGKVVIMVVTDGGENSSKEYRGIEGQRRIKEMIEHQQSVYSWQILFLGANIDATTTGAGFGLARGQTLTYNTAHAGSTYSVASASIGNYRSGVTAGAAFTEEDRVTAMSGNKAEVKKDNKAESKKKDEWATSSTP